MKFVFAVYTLCFLFHAHNHSHALDPELVEAVSAAVKYYNESINLMEKAEMVQRFYEMEWEEGIFLPIKLRIVPERMQKLDEEMDSLKFDAKHKNHNDKKIIRRIQDLEKELIENYGPKDRNFRILKNDPLSQNVIAVNKMKTRVDGLIEDFRDYTVLQRRFVDTYSALRNQLGIYLTPSNDDSIFLFAQNEEDLEDLLKKFKKSENFKETDDMDEIYERLHLTRNAPRQTSQELLALQSILDNRVVDPVTKELLRGFIPDLNEKSIVIITKLKALEALVEDIDTESNEFVFSVMDKRESLFADLDELQEKFDVKRYDQILHEVHEEL